jgi:predicted O-methyltransferase YrrM
MERQWAAVDKYLEETLVEPDPSLEAALSSSAAAGLPAINVTPSHGKLLHLLARVRGARAILEIGTLAGYSTIWLARALPADGYLITLEAEKKHADIARANLERAGVSAVVDVRVGPALHSLPLIAAEGRGPFDLVFIDADKPNTPEYFRWALELSRPGSLIIVDNVVRGGAVVDERTGDERVVAMRRLHEMLSSEKRVAATVIQTVGGKGYDGFAVALVV